VAAKHSLRAAVRRGEIARAVCCEVAGCDRADWLQAHHQDYRKPRDVIFLCRKHHEDTHHLHAQRLKHTSKRKFARAPRVNL
jgi:hypothetical protein